MITAGIVFIIVGIIADDGMLVQRIACYCREDGGYGSAGIAALVFVGIIVISTAVSAV